MAEDAEESLETKARELEAKIERISGCEAKIWSERDEAIIHLKGDIQSQHHFISNIKANESVRVSEVQRHEDWDGEPVVTFKVER